MTSENPRKPSIDLGEVVSRIVKRSLPGVDGRDYEIATRLTREALPDQSLEAYALCDERYLAEVGLAPPRWGAIREWTCLTGRQLSRILREDIPGFSDYLADVFTEYDPRGPPDPKTEAWRRRAGEPARQNEEYFGWIAAERRRTMGYRPWPKKPEVDVARVVEHIVKRALPDMSQRDRILAQRMVGRNFSHGELEAYALYACPSAFGIDSRGPRSVARWTHVRYSVVEQIEQRCDTQQQLLTRVFYDSKGAE